MAGTIDFSGFQLVEKSGSTLSINCYALDNVPLTPSTQPAGIETSSPLDGNLLTLTRDGKPSVAIRACNANSGGSNPEPGIAFNYYGAAPPNFNWYSLLYALQALGNGYQWTFNNLYSNYPPTTTGIDNPGVWLPTPSQFRAAMASQAQPFKIGATVTVPIQARCTSYTSSCPWADVGIISGDDPLVEDTSVLRLLAFSDMTDTWQGGDLTVQSAALGAGNVPAATGTYGPTTLTPDANGAVTATLSGSPALSGSTVTPEVDGVLVTFDEGLALGQSVASGRTRTVYVPIRSGETGSGGAAPPDLYRTTFAAICLRADLTGDTTYSEPRNAFWRLSSDSKNRLVATLVNGFAPFASASNHYPTRAGAVVSGVFPSVRVFHSVITAVYRRLDNIWVAATSIDQVTTLGAETVLFNQSGGNVTFEYDQATGSQYYVMSLRDDGLSWQTTPAASSDPSRLPQVAVIRRRDSAGNSIPFITAPGAAISGTVWENVVYLDEVSNGTITLKVLPQGTVVLTCGTQIYTSMDNGSNFYDQSSTLVQSLTNQTSMQLQSGATGGTQNP